MSTAHDLFVPENNPKALFPTAPSSKPTSEITPHTCDINHEHPKEEEEEEEEEEMIIPTTAAAAAAAVSVSVTLDTEESNKETKDVTVKFGGDDDEDDGYHTPTSPRHRILVDMKYPPPPPKKKPSRVLYAKRKERTARARVWVDIDGEISSFLCVELLDATSRQRKRAKTCWCDHTI